MNKNGLLILKSIRRKNSVGKDVFSTFFCRKRSFRHIFLQEKKQKSRQKQKQNFYVKVTLRKKLNMWIPHHDLPDSPVVFRGIPLELNPPAAMIPSPRVVIENPALSVIILGAFSQCPPTFFRQSFKALKVLE